MNSKDNMVRTDMNCTNCSKNFIAKLDFNLNGNHVIECPYCGHEHLRIIKDGVMTEGRWGSREQRINVDKRCVWKADSKPMMTSTAAYHIRDLWLNKLDWNK